MVFKLLFPSRCVICRSIIPDAPGETICRKCMKSLPLLYNSARHSEGKFFDDCVSACSYEGELRKSLLRFKFGGKRQYAGAYAHLLAGVIKEEYDGEYDLISWVPVSRRRKIKRGYDQAMLLAKAVSAELGMECVGLLRKKRHNRPQSGMKTEAERRANVLGAYEAVGEILDKRILIVDDIVTTGSTLGEASRTLLMSRAKSVLCATVAKRNRQKKD